MAIIPPLTEAEWLAVPIGDLIAAGYGWVPRDNPLWGTPGFIGHNPSAPTPLPEPLPVPTSGGPLVNQPDAPHWPPRALMAAPGSYNEYIEHHARMGIPLPLGDVYFTPPLLLRDVALLQGTAGRTILRPDPSAPMTTAPAIIVESTLPGSQELHYPCRTVIRDLFISGHHAPGSRGQCGMSICGANILLDTVSIRGFGEGLHCYWAVNVAVRDCRFINNNAGVVIGGVTQSAASGAINVTTLRFSGCSFGLSAPGTAGVAVFHGLGVVFDDGCIWETNPSRGLWAVSSPADSVLGSLVVRDGWFEGNGVHIDDPQHVVRVEGVTAFH